jgi:hypothetical protein
MNAQKFIDLCRVEGRRSGMNAALRRAGFSPLQRSQAWNVGEF